MLSYRGRFWRCDCWRACSIHGSRRLLPGCHADDVHGDGATVQDGEMQGALEGRDDCRVGIQRLALCPRSASFSTGAEGSQPLKGLPR